MGYKKLMQAIENGTFDFENSLLKRVTLQLEEEFKNPQLLLSEGARKMMLHTLDYAQEAMKKEAKKVLNDGGTFYRDVDEEQAIMIIDDIKSLCGSRKKALNLIELFINNLMTVEEIEMILY